MAKYSCLMMMVAVMTVALLFGGGRGQSDCAVKLVPCVDYLNSTKPSAECCKAMETVVKTQLPCLCGLLKNPSALAGINITQALELPKHCNLPSDTSACNAAEAPGSSSLSPPVTPGGNGGENGAGKISGMGALLLTSAFTFFY